MSDPRELASVVREALSTGRSSDQAAAADAALDALVAECEREQELKRGVQVWANKALARAQAAEREREEMRRERDELKHRLEASVPALHRQQARARRYEEALREIRDLQLDPRLGADVAPERYESVARMKMRKLAIAALAEEQDGPTV